MSILLDENTRVLVQGATGAEARRLIPTMVNYGTRIVAGVSLGHGGEDIDGIPVYGSVAAALREHEIDLSVLFIPARFSRDAALEAIDGGIPVVNVVAAGVPTAYLLLRDIRFAVPRVDGAVPRDRNP